jgi:RNA recognition motif-containing protein
MDGSSYVTIYVTGLPRRMTAAQLAQLCAVYGTVQDVRMECDPQTGAAWPFGYVRFSTAAQARLAASSLHGKHYRGDILAARQTEAMPNAA